MFQKSILGGPKNAASEFPIKILVPITLIAKNHLAENRIRGEKGYASIHKFWPIESFRASRNCLKYHFSQSGMKI